MKIYNWKRYRRGAKKIGDRWRPGLITIALYDDFTIGKFKYIWAPENHEELAERPPTEIGDDPIQYLTQQEIVAKLKSLNFDLGNDWHTMFDIIFNYGGVNLNLKTNGYKSFEPLTKDPSGGIEWDTHENEVIPPTTRKR